LRTAILGFTSFALRHGLGVKPQFAGHAIGRASQSHAQGIGIAPDLCCDIGPRSTQGTLVCQPPFLLGQPAAKLLQELATGNQPVRSGAGVGRFGLPGGPVRALAALAASRVQPLDLPEHLVTGHGRQ
jgi:hypothetical protein